MTRSMMSVFAAVATRRRSLSLLAHLALVFATVLTPTMSKAVEEPDFVLVKTLGGNVEIRQYAPYVVAEVLVTGPADKAGGQAFPILAGYIFGKNKGEKKLAMTAPVTQVAAPVKLEMTAPVTQVAAPNGFVVQFVLPKGVTLASAPEPIDPRVRLRLVPAAQLAVIRYSGFWSQANYQEHLDKLKAAMATADLRGVGEPILSRYNDPFTPWFLRRNEIWIALP